MRSLADVSAVRSGHQNAARERLLRVRRVGQSPKDMPRSVIQRSCAHQNSAYSAPVVPVYSTGTLLVRAGTPAGSVKSGSCPLRGVREITPVLQVSYRNRLGWKDACKRV